MVSTVEKQVPKYLGLHVSREEYLDLEEDGFRYDLIAEVLSPSTRSRDLGIKAERYLACGVKEYWIVDPENSKIHLWRNLGNEWKKESGDELVSSVLQGLVIVKKEIFE